MLSAIVAEPGRRFNRAPRMEREKAKDAQDSGKHQSNPPVDGASLRFVYICRERLTSAARRNIITYEQMFKC